jgi:polysaccharide biosynthesis/export protein
MGRRLSEIHGVTGNRLKALLVGAGSAAMLGGCGGPNFDPATASAVNVGPSFTVPTQADIVRLDPAAALLGPGDKLEFKVLGLAELDRTVRVDSNGMIALPLIGDMQVAGSTAADIRAQVERRLGERYLQNPDVTLEVVETLSRRFVIDGGVRTPGVYAITGNQTLIQAVAQAQGVTETARLSEVVVFRDISGVPHAALFNLADIRGGRAADPAIFPNDRIIVGNNENRALLRDIIALSPFVGAFVQVAR